MRNRPQRTGPPRRGPGKLQPGHRHPPPAMPKPASTAPIPSNSSGDSTKPWQATTRPSLFAPPTPRPTPTAAMPSRNWGRLDKAIASYNRAIALRPDYAEAYSNRGNALKGILKFDEAVASYNQAVAIRPDYTDAWYNRGVALLELGQLDEAIASYNRAIAIRPRLCGRLLEQVPGAPAGGTFRRRMGAVRVALGPGKPPLAQARFSPAPLAGQGASRRQDDPPAQRAGMGRHDPVLPLCQACCGLGSTGRSGGRSAPGGAPQRPGRGLRHRPEGRCPAPPRSIIIAPC